MKHFFFDVWEPLVLMFKFIPSSTQTHHSVSQCAEDACLKFDLRLSPSLSLSSR